MGTKKLKNTNKPRKTHYKKKHNHKTRKFYGKGPGSSKPINPEQNLNGSNRFDSKSKSKPIPNNLNLDLPSNTSKTVKSRSRSRSRSRPRSRFSSLMTSCIGSACAKPQVLPQGSPVLPQESNPISNNNISIHNKNLDDKTIEIFDEIYDYNQDIYTINNMIYRLIKISGYSEMIILGKIKMNTLFQSETQKLIDYLANNNLKLINETDFIKKNRLLKYYTYKTTQNKILQTPDTDFYTIETNNNDLFYISVQIIQNSYDKIFLETDFVKKINNIYLFQMNIFLIVHFYLGYLNSFIDFYKNHKINTVLNTKTDLQIINKREENISKIMKHISDYYVKIEVKNNFEDIMPKMIMFKNINSLLNQINAYIIDIDSKLVKKDSNYFIKIENLIIKFDNLQYEIKTQISVFDEIKTTIFEKQKQEKDIMMEEYKSMKSFIETEKKQEKDEINLMNIEEKNSKNLPKTNFSKTQKRKVLPNPNKPTSKSKTINHYLKIVENLSLRGLFTHMREFLQYPNTSEEKKKICRDLFMNKLKFYNITLHDIYIKFKKEHEFLELNENEIIELTNLEKILKKIKVKYHWSAVQYHPDKNKMNIPQEVKTEMFQKIGKTYQELTAIYTHFFKIKDFIEKYSNKNIENFKKFIIDINNLFFDLTDDDEENVDTIDELLELYKLDQK